MALPELSLHTAGSCVHPEHVVLRNGVFKPMCFPAMYAVLEHEKHGVFLYDTGYSERFFEATRSFPNKLYAWTTPVSYVHENGAAAELARRGIRPEDVRGIIVSHFHADHVAAIAEFPRARYYFLPSAWASVKKLRGIGALRKGFLPELLPRDFESRAEPLGRERERPLPASCAPFTHGYDLFGDGHVLAVELPGHAVGQIGLYVETAAGSTFLVADACWTSKSYEDVIAPHPITKLLFADTDRYVKTLEAIRDVHRNAPDVRIVPSHCEDALRAHGAWP